MLAACAAWILAACLSSAPPAGAAGPAGDQAWAKVFAQDPPAPAAIDAVLAACGHDASAVARLMASDTAYARLRAGWFHRKVQVGEGKSRYDTSFEVLVPDGYDPGRSWPVLLACHGTGGTGGDMAFMLKMLLGKAASARYVVVGPTIPGPEGWSGKPYQSETFLKPLEWVRRNLNIDDDRIYVAGYSMGGHAAWFLGAMYPRLFAAAVPMAGVPWFEGSPYTTNLYLGNMLLLPVWAIWGELDRAKPPVGTVDQSRWAAAHLKRIRAGKFTGTELPGVGHMGCWPARGKFAEYLSAHKRTAAPEQFNHFFHHAHHSRGYYIEATALTRAPVSFEKHIPFTIPIRDGKQPPLEEMIRVAEGQLARSLFKISARVDRPANSLSIATTDVRSLRVYVVEGLLDLDRPVMVNYAGRSWRGNVPRSARCVLTHYAAARDAAAPVYNEIDLDAAGSVTVRFK